MTDGDRTKRALDLALSMAVLALASPIMGIVALLVRRRLGSPVLFKQSRPGLKGQPFVIYKFRTMTDDRDSRGMLLPDEKRLTPLGRWLRATSLDELPELWNVVVGDMSLVGPRPLLPEYLDHYTREQARRHEVRPGITGWAQIHGRNDISWDEKLALDVWYVDNRSTLLDLRILLRTLVIVTRRAGIRTPGHATAPRFDDPGVH